MYFFFPSGMDQDLMTHVLIYFLQMVLSSVFTFVSSLLCSPCSNIAVIYTKQLYLSLIEEQFEGLITKYF